MNLDSENDTKVIFEILFVCTIMFSSGRITSQLRGDITNRLVDCFEENQCVPALEELLSHKNQEISEFAQEIIEEYFCAYIKGEEIIEEHVGLFKFS